MSLPRVAQEVLERKDTSGESEVRAKSENVQRQMAGTRTARRRSANRLPSLSEEGDGALAAAEESFRLIPANLPLLYTRHCDYNYNRIA
jgi:hypothetical protein